MKKLSVILVLSMSIFACKNYTDEEIQQEIEKVIEQKKEEEKSENLPNDSINAPNDSTIVAPEEKPKFEPKLLQTKGIFQDGEPDVVVMNRQLRWWNLMKPVRVDTTNIEFPELKANQILITSYALKPVKNLKVFAGDEEIIFIPELPALSQNVYELADTFVKSNFEFSLSSDDEFYKKLTAVKTNWNVAFGKTAATSPLDCGALEARVLIGYITDMAYTMSCPEFETLLNNYETITYGKFKNDAGVLCDLASGSAERENLEKMIYKPDGWDFTLGLMDDKNVAGQAYTGTGRMSVNIREIARHFQSGAPTGYHEFGHTINYGHSSSFSLYDINVLYENQNVEANLPDGANNKRTGSLREYLCGLHTTLVRFKMAPYSDDNIFEEYLNTKYDGVRKSNKVIESDESFRGGVRKNFFERNYVKFWQKYNGTLPDINNYTPEKVVVMYMEKESFSGKQYLNHFEKSLYRGNITFYPQFAGLLAPYFDAAEKANLVSK